MTNNEIKSFITDIMTGINGRIEAKYDIIDLKLDNINERLDKLNGKVAKHEKIINEEMIEKASNREKQNIYFKNIDDFINKVNKHEKIINEEMIEKAANHEKQNTYFKDIDDFIVKIRKLEDNNLSNKTIKRFMFYMFTSGAGLGAMIVGAVKLFM